MIKTMEQRIAAAEAALARLKHNTSKFARQQDIRRKVLVGAFILERLGGGLPDGFDEWLVRSRDREIFGLSPRVGEQEI